MAQPVDDLVARRVLELLTTPAFRKAVLSQSGPADDGSLCRALAALGSAHSRMQTLDDNYVRGAIGQRWYRSIRTRLDPAQSGRRDAVAELAEWRFRCSVRPP